MGLLRDISKESVYSIYKRYQFKKLKAKGQSIINEYLRNSKSPKLHIGAGGSYLEGWLNVDLEPLKDTIAFMDAGTDYPIPTESINLVFSEHLFEHLTLDQQVKMLSEVLRVLKPGGTVRIATPNLDAILDIRGRGDQLVKDYLKWGAETYFPSQVKRFGDKAKNEIFIINNYFYSWGHQFIHNPTTLRMLLENAGFANIRQLKIFESKIVDFQNLETHGNVIPPQFNEMETMVFEAEK